MRSGSVTYLRSGSGWGCLYAALKLAAWPRRTVNRTTHTITVNLSILLELCWSLTGIISLTAVMWHEEQRRISRKEWIWDELEGWWIKKRTTNCWNRRTDGQDRLWRSFRAGHLMHHTHSLLSIHFLYFRLLFLKHPFLEHKFCSRANLNFDLFAWLKEL